MPGIPTKFVIADKVRERLANDNHPRASLATASTTAPYFYLGALGSALGDFIPARPELANNAPNSPYFRAWQPVLELFADTSARTGVHSLLSELEPLLLKIRTVVNARSKLELFGLLLDGKFDRAVSLGNQLSAVVGNVQGLLQAELNTIATANKPKTRDRPSSDWSVRDAMAGSRTGRFLTALRQKVGSASNPRLDAYELGAGIGYAADLCGNPFVNSVVNAPDRNDWWRHRFVSNYIDTWALGYYKQGGASAVSFGGASGLDPTPPFRDWPLVGEAFLHERLGFGLQVDPLLKNIGDRTAVDGSFLDPSFVTAWTEVFNSVYGTSNTPAPVDAAGLRSGVAMAWLTLWLQTSGEAIPCMPTDRIQALIPQDCGDPPPWISALDGSVIIDNITIPGPPPAARDLKPDVAKTISMILLAILGIILIAVGGVLAGVIAIAVAVEQAVDAVVEPDWESLRCYIGWVVVLFYKLTNNFHDMMTSAGLGFPYTEELAHVTLALPVNGLMIPWMAAAETTRSRYDDGTYPQPAWPAVISDWALRRTGSAELPVVMAYPTAPTWPYHFVDGICPGSSTSENDLVTLQGHPDPLFRDAAEFAARTGVYGSTRPISSLFGNAVEVARKLIDTPAGQVLDWDLGADPGIGFPTWRLPSANSPRSAAQAEP